MGEGEECLRALDDVFWIWVTVRSCFQLSRVLPDSPCADSTLLVFSEPLERDWVGSVVARKLMLYLLGAILKIL